MKWLHSFKMASFSLLFSTNNFCLFTRSFSSRSADVSVVSFSVSFFFQIPDFDFQFRLHQFHSRPWRNLRLLIVLWLFVSWIQVVQINLPYCNDLDLEFSTETSSVIHFEIHFHFDLLSPNCILNTGAIDFFQLSDLLIVGYNYKRSDSRHFSW